MQPSHGQLEELRRAILRLGDIKALRDLVSYYRVQSARLGGDAWQAFDFNRLDTPPPDFSNDFSGWKIALDTSLRIQIGKTRPNRDEEPQ